MEIVYTSHARQRMLKRRITFAMVEETLRKPTTSCNGTENKKIAFREFESGVVEVVFVEEAGKLVVVSARWS